MSSYEDFDFSMCIGLFYDKAENIFWDQHGEIVENILEIVSASDLYLFHRNQDYMLVPHRQDSDIGVELFYSTDGCVSCNYCVHLNKCMGEDEDEDEDDD